MVNNPQLYKSFFEGSIVENLLNLVLKKKN